MAELLQLPTPIGTHRGGFQFLLILDLWGISFHAVIVFSLGNDLLFKSALGHCDTFQTKVELVRVIFFQRNTRQFQNFCSFPITKIKKYILPS